MPRIKPWSLHPLIIATAAAVYIPFINQAINIDSDMLVHVSRQLLLDPIDPPLGEYGRNMILHDVTEMPPHSVYRRSAHPPLLPLLLSPIARYAGMHEWPFHAAMFFFYCAAIYGGWYLFGRVFSRRLQLYGTFIWALCPALLVNAHSIMWDVPVTAFMLWALALFIDGIKRHKDFLFIMCGIITGMAAVTKANCLPLYGIIGGYLVFTRQYRFLLLWLPGAVLFPVSWILHNLLVFGKIQYLSTGLFNPIIGDIRYRFERIVSFLGGCVLFPIWWYWLLYHAVNHRIPAIVIAGATFIWSTLLWQVLELPAGVCAAYWIFSTAGGWVLYRMCLWWRDDHTTPGKRERLVLSVFAGLYTLQMLFMPTASVRYMLPFIPCAIAIMLQHLRFLGPKESRWWRISNLTATAVLSLGLSISDYCICDADRQLPGALIERGYQPCATWYFGRLSFDYYLFRGGFQNARTSSNVPQTDDHAVEELFPGDYRVKNYLSGHFSLIPVDTLHYYRLFPQHIRGNHAGFYGTGRLPYSWNRHVPQKAYVVSRLH